MNIFIYNMYFIYSIYTYYILCIYYMLFDYIYYIYILYIIYIIYIHTSMSDAILPITLLTTGICICAAPTCSRRHESRVEGMRHAQLPALHLQLRQHGRTPSLGPDSTRLLGPLMAAIDTPGAPPAPASPARPRSSARRTSASVARTATMQPSCLGSNCISRARSATSRSRPPAASPPPRTPRVAAMYSLWAVGRGVGTSCGLRKRSRNKRGVIK
jgi:hypothetical protein